MEYRDQFVPACVITVAETLISGTRLSFNEAFSLKSSREVRCDVYAEDLVCLAVTEVSTLHIEVVRGEWGAAASNLAVKSEIGSSDLRQG